MEWIILLIVIAFIGSALNPSSDEGNSKTSNFRQSAGRPRAGKQINQGEVRSQVFGQKTAPNKKNPAPTKIPVRKTPKAPGQRFEALTQGGLIARELCKKGVLKLWYMTHIKNIASILEYGILSHSDAEKKVGHVDISDHDVQRWRTRLEPLYKRPLHQYAPTYINIRNPMLYVRRGLNEKLCLLEVSLDVLRENNFVFTDGNAASRSTRFYNSLHHLQDLPWDVLNSSYWNDFPDGRRKRCAEFLIYPKIDPEFIKTIHCFSINSVRFIANVKADVRLSTHMFF